MKKLIGMIHLPCLQKHEGMLGINACIKKAERDLDILQRAGFDGALIENYFDEPEAEFVTQPQTLAMGIVAWELAKKATIALGAQMLLNDYLASFDICKAAHLSFTRLDVFVDNVRGRWGDIYPEPQKIMTYKKEHYPELTLYTDIHVKHKQMLDPNKTLEQSAKEALTFGTDGIVVTGTATGQETDLQDLKRVKAVAGNIPVIIGSGITAENLAKQLAIADIAIVGTGIKTGEYVDFNKAQKLVILKNQYQQA